MARVSDGGLWGAGEEAQKLQKRVGVHTTKAADGDRQNWDARKAIRGARNTPFAEGKALTSIAATHKWRIVVGRGHFERCEMAVVEVRTTKSSICRRAEGCWSSSTRDAKAKRCWRLASSAGEVEKTTLREG
jgi:hypothetical protein